MQFVSIIDDFAEFNEYGQLLRKEQRSNVDGNSEFRVQEMKTKEKVEIAFLIRIFRCLTLI
jgi:hypothetical protein